MPINDPEISREDESDVGATEGGLLQQRWFLVFPKGRMIAHASLLPSGTGNFAGNDRRATPYLYRDPCWPSDSLHRLYLSFAIIAQVRHQNVINPYLG